MLVTNTNELRQSVNEIEVYGMVKEADLTAKSKVDNNGNKVDYLTGKLTIWVSDEKEVVVNAAYITKFNKNGDVKKVYTTLLDIANKKLPTMANLAEFKQVQANKARQMYSNDAQMLEQELAKIEAMEATVVSIWGSDSAFKSRLADNTFWSSKDEKIVEGTPKIDLGFANVTVKTEYNKADFFCKGAIEIFITGVVPVEGKDETIVKGYSVAYGSKVFPIEVVAVAEEGGFNFADMCASQLTAGMTVTFFIDVVFGKKVTKIERGGFGKPTISEKTTYYQRFETLGGELTNDVKSYDEEAVRQAVTVRKTTYFSQLETDAKNRENQPKPQQQGFGGTGFGAGFGAPAQAPQRPNPSSLF